ncbi:MAG: hypothetical protein ACJ8CB_32200 [Ktedonobacteraceae bacterium]
MRDVAADFLAEIPNAPKPEVHSPDQSDGDVADIPFFPNARIEEERRRRAEAERRRQAEEEQARKEEEERRRKAEEHARKLAEEERARQAEEERRRQAEQEARAHIAEEERRRQAEEERVRQAEESRRRQAEQEARARLAMEKRAQNIARQASPMPSQTFPPTTSPDVAMPPQDQNTLSSGTPPRATATTSQRPGTLPSRPILTQPKRQRSPSGLAVLILLVLILLGGGSFGIYRTTTGNWPWNASQRPSTPTLANTGTQINATSTAQANTSVLGQTWHTQPSGTSQSLLEVAWSGTKFVAVGGVLGVRWEVVLSSPQLMGGSGRPNLPVPRTPFWM